MHPHPVSVRDAAPGDTVGRQAGSNHSAAGTRRRQTPAAQQARAGTDRRGAPGTATGSGVGSGVGVGTQLGRGRAPKRKHGEALGDFLRRAVADPPSRASRTWRAVDTEPTLLLSKQQFMTAVLRQAIEGSVQTCESKVGIQPHNKAGVCVCLHAHACGRRVHVSIERAHERPAPYAVMAKGSQTGAVHASDRSRVHDVGRCLHVAHGGHRPRCGSIA